MKSAKNGRSVQISIILGVFFMYISSNPDQITIEEFFLPFGGKLLKKNRWVKLASIMPWEHIEQIYMAAFQSENGRPALSSRIAFGAIFIKENDHLTDEGTVEAIAENPYMQYFLGLTAGQQHLLFCQEIDTHAILIVGGGKNGYQKTARKRESCNGSKTLMGKFAA